MKLSPSTISLLLVCTILFLAGLACSSGGRETSSTEGNTTATSTAASSTPASALSSGGGKDIAGAYSITGTNASGGGNYNGTLVVTNRDDVYQFSWDSNGRKYDGVGVQTDNNIAVAFTDGNDGTGCGVVLYKIAADGTLDGKAGYWGNNSSESETAKRTKGTDLEGEYQITGSNTGGGSYSGTLGVQKSGTGYAFTWNTGSTLKGFGIRQGDKVSVGIGGGQCGFVAYTVAADGTLEGKWGSSASTSFGTETAKKK